MFRLVVFRLGWGGKEIDDRLGDAMVGYIGGYVFLLLRG